MGSAFMLQHAPIMNLVISLSHNRFVFQVCHSKLLVQHHGVHTHNVLGMFDKWMAGKSWWQDIKLMLFCSKESKVTMATYSRALSYWKRRLVNAMRSSDLLSWAVAHSSYHYSSSAAHTYVFPPNIKNIIIYHVLSPLKTNQSFFT